MTLNQGREATTRALLRSLIMEQGVEDILRVLQMETNQMALAARGDANRMTASQQRFITLNYAERMERHHELLRRAQEEAMLVNRLASLSQDMRDLRTRLGLVTQSKQRGAKADVDQ